jgi:RHS repeat-associated protein
VSSRQWGFVFVRAIATLAVAFGFATTLLSAQGNNPNGPRPNAGCPPEGCTFTVHVTPDNAPVQRAPNSGPYTAVFNVENNGNSAGGFTLTCKAVGGVTCGTVTPSGVSLNAGMDANVSVQYNVTTGGTLRLTATHGTWTDAGSYNVSAAAAGPPVVTLRNYNDSTLDRSLCLTAGAGEAAGIACGDLVVTHAMPGYTSMGRERKLTLLYNSRGAYDRPIITAAVREPSTVTTPTSIYVELEVAGVVRKTATYFPWGNNLTQQIAISYDAIGLGQPTGIYPFTLRVQNQYPTAAHTASVTGYLMLVNLHQSRFGAGFNIAGLEQLFLNQPNGSILWTTGDGSAKIYGPTGTANQWRAPSGGFRDLLVYNPADSTYTRTLRYGIKVVFKQFGSVALHTATINRTGQRTDFAWSLDTLKTITVPPGGTTNRYTLAYDLAGRLDKITDPASRVLDLTVTGGLLMSAKDPGGTITVDFGYDGDRKMTSRKSRRGFTTVYEYAKSHRVTKATIPVGRDLSDNTVAVTQFQPWDEKGLVTAATTQIAVDTAQAFTRILGPRLNVNDDASFWVDRWGAPTRIVNAIGVNTRIVRGQATTPALVTQVTYPNNRIVKMSWDTLANLTSVRDSTSHLGADGQPTKGTSYTYGSSANPYSPTIVTDGLGRITRYSYMGLGLTDSTIDQRGHRTKFLYDSTTALKGVVKQVIERAVQTWRQSDSTDVPNMDLVYRFAYDAKGNAKVDTAANKTVTSYVRDNAGRVTSLFDALNTERVWVYDDLNRVKQSIWYPTAQPNPYALGLGNNCDTTQVICSDPTLPANPVLSTLTNNYKYGPIDLDSVVDPRFVTRIFDHDARGLVWNEINDVGVARTARYGLGGTLDTATSRAGTKVTFQYDVLGRRTQVQYPANVITGPCDFDDTRLCAFSDTIPGETITYTYDSLNNLLSSSGAQGTITRKYYQDGSLKMKISSITGLAPDTLIYSYDSSGARTRLIHGRDMRETTDYFYGTITGDLDSMKVTYGAPVSQAYTFGFSWDGLGRRKQVLYPIITGTKRMFVTLSYDAAGTLRRVRSAHPDSLPAVSNRLSFTFRNERVDAIGRILKQATTCRMLNGADVIGSPCSGATGTDSTVNGYNRLSMLVKQTHKYGTSLDVDSMGYDASGNMVFRRDGKENLFHNFTMTAYSNRLEVDVRGSTPYYFVYNPEGSRSYEQSPNAVYEDRWLRYDGLERMSGSMWWDVPSGGHLIDNPTACLYDPEGQMVKPCDNGAPKLAFEGHNVVAAGNVGLNWSFVHGPGLDDPLMGLARWPTGNKKVFFWVTDGQGRQLVFADSAGRLAPDEYNMRYGQDGGKYAGGTGSANSFEADRFSTPSIPGLSFFRNRAYDRETGRWTQEDPSGVAGGLNLYQFNANNPVSHSDPFGLCPGKKGSGTICIAFYIRSETTLLNMLMGDGREPSSSSHPDLSRAYVIVDPSNPGAAKPEVNESCTTWGNCQPPSGSNKFNVESDGNGGFNVSVDIVNSQIGGLRIDAAMNFWKDADGKWRVRGSRDGYPSLEAYYYGKDGTIQEITNKEEGWPIELVGSGDEALP